MEWQDELGLNMYDMYMRDYDPAIGRWTGIDPVTHFDQSPYMAMDGDPVYWADPSGADGVGGMGGYYLNWAANQAYLNSSLGSSSNWGQSAVGGSSIDFMSSFENSAYSTNDRKEIGGIIGYYARQSGYTGFSYTYADSFNDIHGIGVGFYQYSRSGSGINGVGEPGAWESVIPVWGSGRAAVNHFQNGNYWRGAAYTALAISDVFLVKAAVVAVGRGIGIGAMKLAATETALSSSELLRIENAATRIGQPITVVGSRASGTANALSDWDYVIKGINSKNWSKIKNSLPGAGSVIDNMPRNIDIFKGEINTALPYITILPR